MALKFTFFFKIALIFCFKNNPDDAIKGPLWSSYKQIKVMFTFSVTRQNALCESLRTDRCFECISCITFCEANFL